MDLRIKVKVASAFATDWRRIAAGPMMNLLARVVADSEEYAYGTRVMMLSVTLGSAGHRWSVCVVSRWRILWKVRRAQNACVHHRGSECMNSESQRVDQSVNAWNNQIVNAWIRRLNALIREWMNAWIHQPRGCMDSSKEWMLEWIR